MAAVIPTITPDSTAPSATSTLDRKSIQPLSGDPITHGWLKEAIQEGDRINRDDPSFDLAERAQRYVGGDQRSARDLVEDNLWYLPRTRFNESRRAVQAHVSALTDLKAVFQYTTGNRAFQYHGHILTKRAVAWYIQTMADLELADVVINGITTGTADCVVEYDPFAPGGGDTVLVSRDFRDTLPIRPGNFKDPQKWQGLTLRDEYTVNALRALYPTKAHLFRPSSDSWLATLMGRFKSTLNRIVSPTTGTLGGLRDSTYTQRPRSGDCLLYRTYLKDYSTNLTGREVVMGDPGTNWAYVVPPGDPLYPNGRLIVWTPDAIVYDGPNTYLHGQFPLARYMPWQVPWQFLGIPLLYDTMPINDAINSIAQDILLTFKQSVNPQVAYDRNQVGETFMATYDRRKPGTRIKLNGGLGDGIKDLPPVNLPPWALDFWRELFAKHESLTGTANFQALLQARQIPSGDTLQKYFEALTPEIRMEGRRFEAFLRPIAEMLKVNFFQFESTAKRLTILGEDGVSLQDFDFDPGQLVPAMTPEDEGYVPEFDASMPRSTRAKAMWRLITFTVSPNSLLAINAAEQKMLRVQLARMGYYDFWSLMESLEIGNVGQPPPIPLPPLEDPTPEQVMLSMAQQAMGQPAKYIIDPATGQVMELRVPQTVTERLLAQNLLGIGLTQNPAGRKATGQDMPQRETKTDQFGAPRETVSESEPSRNA